MNSLQRPGHQTAMLGMILLGLYIFYVACMVPPAPGRMPASECELVVMAQPGDPYYVLAQEIASFEEAPLANSLEEAMKCRPEFMLWVVSPGYLSDAVMIEYGQVMKEQPAVISLGILSASTLEQARSLWERRGQVQAEQIFSVNAANPAAHIDAGQISDHAQEPATRLPLTITNLQEALQTADYLTFTGHGSNSYLRLDEDTTLKPVDVPALEALVISTGSCQTFRLWNEDSIARRFADQGAAAYAGFVFSPNEGYLIGEFDGLPMRYTWPAFPVGHVIQVQNRGTLQGFASFPYQFLLGDPRTALGAEPPYRLVDIRTEGIWLILTYEGLPAGVIPIRIQDGAKYGYIEALGITAAADQDPFYNSRLQMANIQNDRLLLIVHAGGDLTLRLRLRPPWYWFLGDILLDSLDHTLVFSQQTGGDVLAMVFACLSLPWIGWQVFKKRISRQKVWIATAIGIGAALLQGVYVLARLELATITSKTVVFSPLSLLATFLLSLWGALIFFQARGWRGKAASLLVVSFHSWAASLFGLLAVGAINLLGYLPAYGTALYNDSLGLLPVGTFLLTVFLYIAVLRLACRWARADGQ